MAKSYPMPGAKRIAAKLKGIQDSIEDAFTDEDGNIGIDVRLQVLKTKIAPFFEWRLWDGDSSYDTDHNGYWGAVFVERDSDCLELAKDLIGQCAEHAAQ